MEETQHQSAEDGANNRPGFKNSLLRVKEKCLPGIKGTLLFHMIVNFAMLVIGSINVHNCPVNKSIPVFLIAIGGIALVSNIITVAKERIDKIFQTRYLLSALYAIELVFLCLGIYWIYSVFKPDYNPDSKYYCNKTTYLFAFIYITIILICLIGIIVGLTCYITCACCLAKNSRKSYDPEAQNPARSNQDAATYLTNEEG